MRLILKKYLLIIVILSSANFAYAADTDHFVTTWQTTASDTVITIPTFVGETYNYGVDWNNDLIPDQTGITGDISHDFGSAGIQTIRIVGNFPRIYINNGTEKDKILSIEQWGTGAWSSMNKAFYGASNLVINASDTPNLSAVLSMFKMFADASSIGTGSGSWLWTTDHVTGMAQVFLNASSFDQDISSWNVQNVTNFSGMFNGATLSTANYDALLISWDGQTLSSGESFHGGNSVYCSVAAQNARASIIANDGWSIFDGGLCNQPPVITSPATASVDENQTSVLTVVADDPELGSIVFSKSGGADMDKFAINPSTGILVYNSPPDFETPASSMATNTYVVDVTATDNGSLFDTQTITVTVNNANEAPTITSATNVDVNENQTSVLTIMVSDPESDTISFSKSGADASLFSINANTGELTFINAPDFETPASSMGTNTYVVDVTATDNGTPVLNDSQTITVNVLDIIFENSAPTITTPSSISTPEDQLAVATITADDVDGDNLSLALTGGADMGLFSFNVNTGALAFIDNPDFESPMSSAMSNNYLIEVTVTDDGSPSLSSTKSITVVVTDVLYPPVITSPTSVNVVENETNVLTATATDVDLDVITFSLSGADAALFTINALTGVLVFNNAPDFENPMSSNNSNIYNITIIATDDSIPNQTDSQNLIVTVTDIIDPLSTDFFITTWKTDNQGTSNSTSITLPIKTSFLTPLYHVDWDNDGILDEFNITGEITHDFLIPGTYTIRLYGRIPTIQMAGSGDEEKIISIDQWGTNTWKSFSNSFKNAINVVNNATDAPDLSALTSISQMFSGASSVGLGTANWNWNTSTITSMLRTFSFATSFDANIGSWNIENVTSIFAMLEGVTLSDANYDALLIGWDAQALHSNINFNAGNSKYCTQAAHDARKNMINNDNWSFIDGGHNHSCTLINEPPVFTNNTNVSIAENTTAITPLNAQDHATDTVSFSITGGNDAALFVINTNSNLLSFINAPDFENPTSFSGTNDYEVTITATDDGTPPESSSLDFIITVTDVLENTAPVFTSPGSVNVLENQTQVLTITSTDAESDLVSYAITGGADQLLFSLNTSTNELAFIAPPDFEMPNSSLGTNSYVVQITATDDGIPAPASTVQTLTISVDDVAENQPPIITSATSVDVPENQIAVLTVQATDPESDAITFSISGVDANLFDINANSGVVTFKLAPDFENPGSATASNIYLIDITATDNGSPVGSSTQGLSITVTDVADFAANEVFVTTWKTNNPGTSNNTTITIPTAPSQTYAYNVDWNGDGDFDDLDENVVYTGNATHDFGAVGTYTIKIGGLFPAIYFNNTGDKEKIISIDQWGNIVWKSMSSAFNGASNLVNNAIDVPDLTQCTSLIAAFKDATSIGASTETGNWNWNTSNINNLISTFNGATAFDQDLSSWDISQVSSFSFTFLFGNMSYQNYDALLISWAAQTILTNTSFHNSNAHYCSIAAQDAHDHLTNDLNWTVIDGGLDTNLCTTQNIQITSLPFIDVLENQTSAITLSVNNPNSAQLSFSVSGGNDMNLFAISSTGVVTFINPPDFENPTSASGTNDYFVEVTVSDDSLPVQSDTQLIKVSVQDVIEFNANELFVTTWKTDNPGITNDTTIMISVRGGLTYNYHVDWNGDGDFDDIDEDITYNNSAFHDFGTAGTYTIKIFGDFPAIYFFNNGDKEKLVSIDQWGTTQWTQLSHAFDGATNAVLNATDTPDLSALSDLSLMFNSASAIDQGNGNWNWSTSTITNMTQMFLGVTNFDENLSSWNVENVTNMSNMFPSATLSTSNYDALLIAWDAQNLQSGVSFNAGQSTYCSQLAAQARQNMMDNDNWSIFDNGRCPNRAPEFTSPATASVAENQTSVLTVTTTDIELDTVSYAVSNTNDGQLFNIDAATGEITFIVAPDFESPNSSSGSNTYLLEIIATDDGTPMESSTQILTVTVTDVADNTAPMIVSNAMVDVPENTTDVLTIMANDAESNNISYSISGGVDAALFTLGSSTGNLSFILAPDFETPNSANNSNVYHIQITATDDGNPIGSDTQDLTITVTDVIESMPIDIALQISNAPSSVQSGDLAEYTFVITNIGTQDIIAANVLDTLPTELMTSSWTCVSTGTATCSATGTGEINDSISIEVGSDSLTYTVSATVTSNNFDEFTYQVQVNASSPQFDSDLSNNNQSVTTLNGDILFSNGFEVPIITLKDSVKQVVYDFSKLDNQNFRPKLIIKGINDNNEASFTIHLRQKDGQLYIRYSHKMNRMWRIGQWQIIQNDDLLSKFLIIDVNKLLN